MRYSFSAVWDMDDRSLENNPPGRFLMDFMRHFDRISRIHALEVDRAGSDGEEARLLSRDWEVSARRTPGGISLDASAATADILENIARCIDIVSIGTYDRRAKMTERRNSRAFAANHP